MIQIFDDKEQLSQAAAKLFAEEACKAVAARGRFCVALAGGSTPRQTYHQLALAPLCEQIPWSQVHIFWGDERCVPGDDPRSNARMAHEALLDRVPIPAAQIHAMTCTRNPEASARRYQALLQKFFEPDAPRFDLILLGLGEDGHTASLIPGTAAPQERVRLVTPVQKPGEDFSRLSLTAPLINQARMVAFLVSGPAKAKILRQVQAGPRDQFPAQLIAPLNGDLCWLVDKAATEQAS
ncbi:6-phosphogluconolactonase [Geopsychrobacter electrodiphilus]|uniref:6-phosphogluconolactonase n=1 Tax=Geopsychrobacter electrodiphilus TaxID=225196 RepID=UPI00036B653F|nr:6-phosphogluconolactonase [Geopsychrobacter electrodiphilus]